MPKELKEIIRESLRNQCEIAEAKGGSPTGKRSWTRRARAKAGPNFKSHDTTSLRGDVINPKLYKKNPDLYHRIYNEEAEQLDEISAGLAGRVVVKARKKEVENSEAERQAREKMSRTRTEKSRHAWLDKVVKHAVAGGKAMRTKDLAMRKLIGGDPNYRKPEYNRDSILRGPNYNPIPKARVPATESVQLDEKLKKGMTVKQVIDDFQKSDDPRFAGDSQEQRRKRAIAAWYKLQREETEPLDEISREKMFRYEKKAINQRAQLANKADFGRKGLSDKDNTKLRKRIWGLAKVQKKLFPNAPPRNEEVELEEGKKKSLGAYVWAAELEKTKPGSTFLSQKDAAYKKFWAHDPKTGEKIKEIGKKEKAEKKAFASAKREINSLKRKGK